MSFSHPCRRAFLFFWLSVLSSCGQDNRSANSIDPTSTAAGKALRENLIRSLKELRGQILSGDKRQIAQIFAFPIPDSMLNPSVNDSIFNQQWRQHGNAITREMYDAYSEKILDGANIDEFRKLLGYLNPDSLLNKDKIEYDAIVDTEMCYKLYRLNLSGDSEINVTYGTSSNDHYVAPKKDPNDSSRADDLENDPSSICDHQTWWTFAFDGKKLKLVKQSGAD